MGGGGEILGDCLLRIELINSLKVLVGLCVLHLYVFLGVCVVFLRVCVFVCV